MSYVKVQIEAESEINDQGQFNPGRRVCRDRNGRIHTIWVRRVSSGIYGLSYSYSDDDGATWASTEEVVSDETSVIYTASLCVDADDEPIAAWVPYGATDVRVKRRESGSWSALKTGHGLAKTASTEGSLWSAYDHTNGRFLMILADHGANQTLQFQWTDDDFSTWEESPEVFYSEASRVISIISRRQWNACIDQVGNVHMVLLDDSSGGVGVYYLLWSESSGTWSSPAEIEDLNSSNGDQGGASIVLGIDGKLHVTCGAYKSDQTKVNLRYWSKSYGGSWATGEWGSDQGSLDLFPGLGAVNNGGVFHVQVNHDVATAPGLSLYQRTLGGTWSLADSVPGSATGFVLGLCWDRSLASGRAVSGVFGVYNRQTGTGAPDHRAWYDDATVWGDETGIEVIGEDSVEFGEVAERFSFSVNQTEGVKLGETASEVAELNIGPPAEGIEFGELAGVIHSVVGTDTVEIGEKAARAWQVEAEDAIEFDDEAKRLNFGKDTVAFGEAASAVLVIQVEAEDGITFEEGLAYLPLEGCETEYEPSPAIQATPNALTYTYLLGPWATLEHVVRLPRPEYGDARRNRVQVILHRTRGGARRVYKRTPTYRSLLLSWTGLTRRKLLELEAFLEATAGEDVRFIDHEGRTWRGNVLTPTIDLTHEGPDVGETVLEFEGEAVIA